AAIDGGRHVTGGRDTIHRVAARDIGSGGTEGERAVLGDQVAVGAAGVAGQGQGRGGDAVVEGEGEAGAGAVAGSVDVIDHDGVAAVGRGRGIGAAGRAAIDREAAGDICSGCTESERAVL